MIVLVFDSETGGEFLGEWEVPVTRPVCENTWVLAGSIRNGVVTYHQEPTA